MKTEKFRSKVMQRAHAMRIETGKSISVCLAKSWALYRLSKKLKEGVVLFAFEKADGSLRKAKGTLRNVEHLIKGTGSFTPKTFVYFDMDANGFRSFKVGNFITLY